MKPADAKASSIIFLRISTLGRKSCPRKMGRVWDGKAPTVGQPKEGALQRNPPEPHTAGAESAMGTTEGTMGVSQPGVGQEAAWVGGCQSPPLQRGATATRSAAQEMLNLTQHLRSDGDMGRSEGGTFPPTAASSPLFPRGSCGPRTSSDNGAKTPPCLLRSPAPGHTRGQTFRITQPSLLQHPAPAPGARFAGCSASPGDAGGEALLGTAAPAFGSYANLRFLRGERPARHRCLRNGTGVRAPSGTPACR